MKIDINNKVSIIIPNFNSSKTILRALKSVQNQTYSNFEVIIVDDCSTDDSLSIIDFFISSDDRFNLIKLEVNSGAGVARSQALRHANGKYIAFLDADDFWYEDKLEKQVDVLNKNPEIIIIHSAYLVRTADGNKIRTVIPPEIITLKKLYYSNFIATSTAMYRLNLNGSRYIPKIRARQDYAFWIKLLQLNKGIVYGMSEILCDYYKIPGSISSSLFRNIKYNYNMYSIELGFSFIKSMYYVMFNIIYRVLKALRNN